MSAQRQKAASRAARLDELAEALPQRASALSRLCLRWVNLGITRTEAGVLAALIDRPRRVTELADCESVAQPTITSVVNRLEEQGWVVRRADASDGRAVLVSLTSSGRAMVERLRAEYRNLLQQHLSMVDDRDVEILGRAVELLDGIIDRLKDAMAAAPPDAGAGNRAAPA